MFVLHIKWDQILFSYVVGPEKLKVGDRIIVLRIMVYELRMIRSYPILPLLSVSCFLYAHFDF